MFSWCLLTWKWWFPACRCPTGILVDVGDVAAVVSKGPRGDGVAQPQRAVGAGSKTWCGHLQRSTGEILRLASGVTAR